MNTSKETSGKKIEDYLHLYINSVKVVKAEELHPFKLDAMEYYTIKEFGYWPIIKPILRPLSSMTEEEAIEVGKIVQGHGVIWVNGIIGHKQSVMIKPELTIWLLSKGFDLFGLIDAGLAISQQQTSNV